jgi:hypothetical protein
MNLPLRITFEGKEYTYRVLTKGITRFTTEIKISVEGKDFTLLRSAKSEWLATEITVGDEPALLTAVARNIALRYRL